MRRAASALSASTREEGPGGPRRGRPRRPRSRRRARIRCRRKDGEGARAGLSGHRPSLRHGMRDRPFLKSFRRLRASGRLTTILRKRSGSRPIRRPIPKGRRPPRGAGLPSFLGQKKGRWQNQRPPLHQARIGSMARVNRKVSAFRKRVSSILEGFHGRRRPALRPVLAVRPLFRPRAEATI